MSQERIAELEEILLNYIEKYGQTNGARRYFIGLREMEKDKTQFIFHETEEAESRSG